MATGIEIMEVFESAEYAHLMADFTNTAINTGIETPETIIVALYLLWRDMDFIGVSNDSTELEAKVLDSAQTRGQYAGLYYEEEDFEEEGSADDGLSWVGFGDMWNIFETMLTLPRYKGIENA